MKRRIDLFASLPIEKLNKLALQEQLKHIGNQWSPNPSRGATSRPVGAVHAVARRGKMTVMATPSGHSRVSHADDEAGDPRPGITNGRVVATHHDVRSMVLSQAARLGVAGALAGVLMALVLGRLTQNINVIPGVTATHPATLTVMSALMLAVLFAATWIPARRAISTNPAAALRGE